MWFDPSVAARRCLTNLEMVNPQSEGPFPSTSDLKYEIQRLFKLIQDISFKRYASYID